MTPGLFSIIIPTFNHARYIGECIESVLAQTYPHWEMIIVDDGSTDGTCDVVNSFDDSRIRYVQQEHRGIEGLSETNNTALTMARGEFIAILEGDDFWPHYKLASHLEAFADPETVLSFGYTQEILPDGVSTNLIPRTLLPEEALTNSPVGRASLYMMNIHHTTYFFPVSVAIRRSAMEAVGGFRQPSYLPLVDFPTFLHLTLQGKFAFTNRIMGFWRRHPCSVTRSSLYRINAGVFRYIAEFQTAHRHSLPVTEEELAAVNLEWQQSHWSALVLLGRWFLADSEWEQGYTAFRKALPLGWGWRHRAFARLAMAMSRLHLDVEPVAGLLGLVPFRESLAEMNRENKGLCKELLDEL